MCGPVLRLTREQHHLLHSATDDYYSEEIAFQAHHSKEPTKRSKITKTDDIQQSTKIEKAKKLKTPALDLKKIQKNSRRRNNRILSEP